jgi:hypothetical protein
VLGCGIASESQQQCRQARASRRRKKVTLSNLHSRFTLLASTGFPYAGITQVRCSGLLLQQLSVSGLISLDTPNQAVPIAFSQNLQ